jgi:transcription factor C subunit 3
MDKTKLRFAVDVKPTASYVYGNPIEERVTSTKPPALSPLEPGNPQKIPLWMDLNGHLVQPLWEMGLASVIGCLVLREGLSAKGISSMIKPAMAPWEIEMMLGWLTDIGVVQGEDVGSEKRWKVQEWWWMVL